MITITIDEQRFLALGFAILKAAVGSVADRELAIQSYILLTTGKAEKVIEHCDALIKVFAQKRDEQCNQTRILLGIWRDMVQARHDAGEERPVTPETKEKITELLSRFKL